MRRLRLGPVDLAQRRRQLPIILRAGVEVFGPRLAPLAPDIAAKHFGFDACRGRAVRKPKRRAEGGDVALRVVVGAEGFRTAERLLEKIVERKGAGLARDQVERAHALRRGAERRQRRIARLGEQPLRFAFVDDLEMRRDVGLERKEPQQSLGEGVQRLDLESARRLDGAREQLPGKGEILRPRRRRAAVDDRFRQGVVVEARPLGELAENALRHIGGRRLGVSEAQDLRRRRAIDEEPQDPLRQDVSLAAAGVGRHPSRGSRVRGPGLPLPQRLRDRQAPAHGESPDSASPSAVAHSLTRARWS